MEPQVAPVHALLELNTDLLLHCLDGPSDEDIVEWPTLAEQRDWWRTVSQMAFLRRRLGKPAMVYTRGVRLEKG